MGLWARIKQALLQSLLDSPPISTRNAADPQSQQGFHNLPTNAHLVANSNAKPEDCDHLSIRHLSQRHDLV